MDLHVHGRNVKVTEALRAHAEKKLGKLQRFWGGVEAVQVVMTVEHQQHICEVTIPLRGAVLRGEARAEDMYVAFDLVVEKLERQIRRYKARFEQREKAESPLLANDGKDKDAIVRQKRFPAKPMHPDEAVMRMNLLGHDFFAFVNAETEQVSVVYKRHDGRYGLLEPE